MNPTSAIPVVLVTGFPAAGKSTLVGDCLSAPAFARTALVTNGAGAGASPRFEKRRLTLTTRGCLCCEASGDTRGVLYDLFEAARVGFSDPFDRVLIETSGLADPAPILAELVPGAVAAMGLRDHTVARRFKPGGVVAVVDAIRGERLIAEEPLARAQIALADLVVLTRTEMIRDPASRRELAAFAATLRGLAPRARILDGFREHDDVPAAVAALLDWDPAPGSEAARRLSEESGRRGPAAQAASARGGFLGS